MENFEKPEIHTTKPNSDNAPEPKKSEHLNLHIEAKKEDAFVLNLKNYNLNIPEEKSIKESAKNTTKKAVHTAQAIKSKIPKPNFSRLKKISKSDKYKKPKSPVFQNLKFVFNTILIFIVTFVALNWGSYSQVFINRYEQLTGQTDQSLQVFSEEQPDQEIAYASSSLVNDNFNIPKLTKEITPPGTRIIIPSISTNVPVIDVPEDKLIERNWTALEQDIQNALRSGVVHYPGTPLPGQSGNVVITGHSSYYPWDPGRFKDVFAVLHNLTVGDEIIMFHKQQKYTYQVTESKKVFPYEVDVLNDFNDDRLTLITCTPIGTNLKRLIITAKPV
jgi:LPXTG-site transpeptidase (sortase) family protein